MDLPFSTTIFEVKITMPKFLIVGDNHSRFDHIVEASASADVVILLRDVEAKRPLQAELFGVDAPVYWIPGNHDTDTEEQYDNLFGSSFAANNLHGRVTDIIGVKVAGLGGVFRGKIWSGVDEALVQNQQQLLAACGKGNRWRDGIPLRHRTTIFPSDIETFCTQRADILVTHEGPHFCHNGNRTLTGLAECLQVKAAFHGHHHQSMTYEATVWRQVGILDTYLLDTETLGE